jgi:hypothetical protein
MLVVELVAKVAVSVGPLGIVDGLQLSAVFQSPETGLATQVALPAEAECALRLSMVMANTGALILRQRERMRLYGLLDLYFIKVFDCLFSAGILMSLNCYSDNGGAKLQRISKNLSRA